MAFEMKVISSILFIDAISIGREVAELVAQAAQPEEVGEPVVYDAPQDVPVPRPESVVLLEEVRVLRDAPPPLCLGHALRGAVP